MTRCDSPSSKLEAGPKVPPETETEMGEREPRGIAGNSKVSLTFRQNALKRVGLRERLATATRNRRRLVF